MVNDDGIKDSLNDLFYKKKDYQECMKKCKEYEINQMKHSDTVLYTVFKLMSQLYNTIYVDLNLSIEYLNKAVKVSQGKLEMSSCNWQLGCIYSNFDITKSIHYFKLCQDYYREINESFYLAEVTKNIAILTDNECLFNNSLNLYKSISYEDYINKYLTTKDECLIDCYIAIMRHYIKFNNKQQVFKMINDIGDKYIKTELRKELPGLLSEDQVV